VTKKSKSSPTPSIWTSSHSIKEEEIKNNL